MESPERIEQYVLEAVADVLEISVEEAQLDSSLLGELGGESLDLLDLSFRVERRYNISLPQVNLLQHAQSDELFGPNSLVVRGMITDLGLRVLRAMRPEIDPTAFAPGLHVDEARREVTPRTFVRLVEKLIAVNEAFVAEMSGCARCGVRLEVSSEAPELACPSCSEVYPFPTGDQVMVEELARVHQHLLGSEV